MRHIVSAACGLWLCLPLPVAAQSTTGVLVELYTSQGCSSCPPADEFLSELAQAEGVIALALHVDYWDYIGWEDAFADPAFTERQKMYARAAGNRMIYTPQMIVGGVDRVEGNTPDAVVRFIGKHMAHSGGVELTVTRNGAQVEIRAKSARPLAKGAIVELVRYLPEAKIEIERGENAGRSITYHNIVTSWEQVGDWQGTAPLDMTADAPGDQPVVVIVQEPGPARVLAAARLD
ncbi:MAG: DUF1223 domain-containing protein [Rhodobacteraceae bacterium PARR1]|nr:MAG: DUF1223 domain-containing protein [Rhodobacteraceae bacterium PARR1]